MTMRYLVLAVLAATSPVSLVAFTPGSRTRVTLPVGTTDPKISKTSFFAGMVFDAPTPANNNNNNNKQDLPGYAKQGFGSGFRNPFERFREPEGFDSASTATSPSFDVLPNVNLKAMLEKMHEIATPVFEHLMPDTKTVDDLEVLAREGDWIAYLDEEGTGLVYYFNEKSGQSTWNRPTTTFPKVHVVPPRPLAKEGVWEAYLDQYDTGLVYYCNRFTGKSQWERPTKTFPKVEVTKSPTLDGIQRPIVTQGDWAAYRDQKSNDVYYFNRVTGESTWDPPTENFPRTDLQGLIVSSLVESLQTSTTKKVSAFASALLGPFDVVSRWTNNEDPTLASHGDWNAHYDKSSNTVYYFNGKTGDSTWYAPDDFPEVDGKLVLLAVMHGMLHKPVVEEETGLFHSLIMPNNNNNKRQEPTSKDMPSFLAGFFQDNKPVEEQASPGQNLLSLFAPKQTSNAQIKEKNFASMLLEKWAT